MSHIYINHSKPDKTSDYLKKIIDHKEFIWMLTQRGIAIKLKRTKAGLLWIFLNPLINIAIYSIFFGLIIQVPWAEDSYLLYLFTGFGIWNIFTNISVQGSSVLISNQEIIKKNPFPRITLNIAQCLHTIIEQTPFIIFVSLVSVFYNSPSFFQLIFLPVSIFLTIVFGFSTSLTFARLSLDKRDILYILPHLFQIIIWFTPIFYPISIIPESLISFGYINPIWGLLDMYRYSLNMDTELSHLAILSSLLTIPLTVFSFMLFKNIDKNIPDYL